MFEWDKLIDDCEKYYYTPILMFIVEITALVISIIYGRKSKIGRAFIFYIAFDFCFLMGHFLIVSSSDISRISANRYYNYSNILIALTELLVYFYFFNTILPYNKIKKIIKILAVFFVIIIISYITTEFSFLTNRLSYITYLIGAIEFIFLLPPSLFYFYKILTVNSEIALLKRPTFWIVTGIFFYSLISIPYYLINRYVAFSHIQLWFVLQASLYNIPFAFNFAFLIKAFLCKKPLTI